MEYGYVVKAWGRILRGYQPVLSIEITNRCPLSCPGCYAYQPYHVAGTALENIGEHTGQDMVEGVLRLVAKHRPLLVYLVGGEPLVRYRELSNLLPQLQARGVKAEVVTSAVRPIPTEWDLLDNLTVVVSIDGLQPEHDARRKPATYERILKHIEGRRIVVHCTLTGQMTRRPGYIQEFVGFWSRRPEVKSIRISLFTPQVGEVREEVLSREDRRKVVAELRRLRTAYPKLRLTSEMCDAYLEPPSSPAQCIFSRVTHCLSSDLKSAVMPCQVCGTPDCSSCGCAATAGLEAIARVRLAGVRLGAIFEVSRRIGSFANRGRQAVASATSPLRPLPEPEAEPSTDDTAS